MEEGAWLKLARSYVRKTAQQIATAAGVSLNYIQRIERGDRHMSSEVREKVYGALGFTPDIIGFNSMPLLRKIDGMIESAKSHLGLIWCTLDSVTVAGRRYYTDCRFVEFINGAPDVSADNILRLQYARAEVQAQSDLYENPFLLGPGRPFTVYDGDGNSLCDAQLLNPPYAV